MKNLIYYNIDISLCDQATLRGHFQSIVSMLVSAYLVNIARISKDDIAKDGKVTVGIKKIK